MSTYQENKHELLVPYARFHVHNWATNPPNLTGARTVGTFGTMTIDNQAQLVRIHDGETQGGYAVFPFYYAASMVPGPYVPFTPQNTSATLVQNVPLEIVNRLRRLAVVQVYDAATGGLVDVDIVQSVDNSTTPPTFKIKLTQTSVNPSLNAIVVYL